MSIKISKIRVSDLAKELGVTWKDVVERCTEEGIPPPKSAANAISIGLAETLRQSFRERPPVKAAAEPSKSKTTKRSTRAKGGTGEGAEGQGAPEAGTEAATPSAATEEVRAAAAPSPAPAEPSAVPVAAAGSAPAEPATSTGSEPPRATSGDGAGGSSGAEAPAIAAHAPAAAEEPSAAVIPTSVVPQPTSGVPVAPMVIGKAHRATIKPIEPVAPAPVSSAPRVITKPPAGHTIAPAVKPPVKNEPKRPEVIKPVGSVLTPTKTTVVGPTVIRVEQPDNLLPPRRALRDTPGGAPRVGGSGARPGTPANRRATARDYRGKGRDDQQGKGFTHTDLHERDTLLQHSQGIFKRRRKGHAQRGPSGPGGAGGPIAAGPAQDLVVRVTEPISIKELSAVSGVKAAEILRELVLAGKVATTINSTIETDQAVEIMMKYHVDLEVIQPQSAAEIIESQFDKRERLDERPRPPVVTILGHVDHGKTSLLDRIRNTNVAAGEAGGITQATSAFQVPVKAGEKDRLITFIDTPGHEAFTQMRARGARVTDIAVIVVAADDGVMPQTVESINHARAAGVPIVVALNKIDKPEATESNIQRILGQLAEHQLNPVQWGGETEVVKVSATKGTGIQELLDMLDYQADLRDLKADAKGLAQGVCLEAQMEEGRGTVARLIVQEGHLAKGDFIVCGRAFGRVRDIVNDRGQRIDSAGPSTPVAISGLDTLPDAGDKFYCVKNLKAAENAALERRRIERERELAAPKITLDNIFAHMDRAGIKELPLVVKADVQGSVEALKSLLSKIKSDEVAVSVKHAAVGGINESDVTLAEATKAIVVGFNVTSNAKARALAEAKGIEMRLYEVIYDLVDDVTKAASGLLEPELKLEVLGHAEVREVFRISKVGAVAGCYVTDGVVERNAQIRVTRDGIVIEKDRRLEQLRRFKDDAREVRAGNECGMKIEGYDDIKTGDVLECYKTIKVARGLAGAARKE